MSNVKARNKGGRNSSRHLRTNNKVQNSFSSSNSNSSNWRDNNKVNGVSGGESTNYGYNNHHLTSAFFMLVGLKVQVQKSDGEKYEGILETVSTQLELQLSHATKVTDKALKKTGNVLNEFDTVILSFSDITYIKACGVDLEFGKRDALLIDSDISRANGVVSNERELIQWDAGAIDGGLDEMTSGLEELGRNGSWNFDEMVRINEEKHGVKSTFDNTMSAYMTPIEKQDPEAQRQLELRAEKVALEMKNDVQFKEHDMADSGAGEEEMFSSVSRPQTATQPPHQPSPPAHQPPANQPTVAHHPHMNGGNNIPNNNSTANNNDGFTTYRPKGRKTISEQTNGPRFRQQMGKSQEHHGGGSGGGGGIHRNNNYFASSVGRGHTNQNGNMQQRHNNAFQQQQQQQHHQHNLHASPSKNHYNNHGGEPRDTNQQPKPDFHSSSRPPLSYSAVAMKKQQQMAANQRITAIPGPTSQPTFGAGQPKPINLATPTPQQTLANTDGIVAPSTVPSNKPLVASPEDLAAAKAQVIKNSKNYATIVNPSASPPVVIANSAAEQKPAINLTVTHQTAAAANDNKHEDIKSETKLDTPTTEIASSQDGLMKFGKFVPAVNPEEEKQPDLNSLKEFSEQFKLSESKSRTTKKSAPKTSEVPNRPRSVDEKHPEQDVNDKSNDKTQAPLHSQAAQADGASKHVTSVTSTVTSTLATSTITSTVSLENKSTPINSTLSASAKEFSFNPGAKEFKPTFSPKPQVHRQSSYTQGGGQQGQPSGGHAGVQHHQPHHVSQQQHQQYYSVHPQHPSSILVNPHHNAHQEALNAQHVQHMQSVKPMFATRPAYYPGVGGQTVFSIPTGAGAEFANNANNQQIIAAGGPSANQPAGFIPHPHQNTVNAAGQPQIYFFPPQHNAAAAAGNMYQQSVLQQQGQGMFPVQPHVVHYAQTQAMQQHPSKHFQQQEGGVPGGYVIVSQNGGTVVQQHPNYPQPPPSPSQHVSGPAAAPHAAAGQAFVVNQANNSYPQIASPINPGSNVYRPPTPGQPQQGHHPQQQAPFVMMAHHQHPQANMQAVQMQQQAAGVNQTYIPGQQHPNIYHQGN